MPGILTAVGGLITALAALITALSAGGLLGKPSEKKADSTGGAAQSVAQPPPNPSAESPVSLSQVDRTDARSTAHAILKAYRSRDVIAIANLMNSSGRQIFIELAGQGESHPRYRSIFGDESWRWRAVKSWDGNLGEARYRHYVGTERNDYEANVKFAQITPDEIAVVTLHWDGAKWNWEDIHSPSPEDFAKGRTSFIRSAAPY